MMEATQRPNESFDTFLEETLSEEQRERLEEQIRQRVLHSQVQTETKGSLENAIQEAERLRRWVVAAGSAGVGGGLTTMLWFVSAGSLDVVLAGSALAVIGGILLLFGVRTLPAATHALEGYLGFVEEVREAVTTVARGPNEGSPADGTPTDGTAKEEQPTNGKPADG